MKSFLIFLSFLLLMVTAQHAQQFYSRQVLLDDIDSLCVMINDIHPDMFAYLSRHEFDREVARSKQLVQDSMTRLGFSRIIIPLVANLGDGHTAVFFPYDELENNSVKLFPLNVEVNYRDSSATVKTLHDDQQFNIPSGSRILNINGKNMKEILGDMLRYVSGEKTFYRASRLNKRFAPLLFLLYADSSFSVEYLHEDKVGQVFVNGIPYPMLREAGRQIQINEPSHSLLMDADYGIAILRFDSFEDIYVLKSFIDSAFRVIHENNTENLIIDIRRNGGGDSRVADEIFQYISPVPFSQVGKIKEKRSTRLRKYLKEQFDYTFNDTARFKQFNEPPLTGLRENPLRYSGMIWLLTSHFTFSAAADMAWAFKYFDIGTIAGEETGGMAVCFGAVISQKLPNTRIVFGVPYKHFCNIGASDDYRHGTIPDHEVPEAMALDYVLELIKNNAR
jgi:hypothetical protein